jgi:hypothetical protein
MIKALKSLGRMLTIALLTCVVFLLSCQSKIIYYPRPYDTAQVKAFEGEGGRKLEYTTSQGKQTAFYLPPQEGANPSQPPPFVWFVFGGNGSLSLDYSDEPPFWDKKLGYVFVDYPGYGLCQGSPNPKRIGENASTVAEKLRKEFGWTEEEFRARSGVFGHSIGCASALIMADNMHLNRAVLCAPFTSLTDMGRVVLGWPLCYINMHRFDNVARLDSIAARGNAEVRIFHGTHDEVIPVRMAHALRDRFPRQVRYTEMNKSHHNDVVTDAREDIGRAIRELSTPTSGSTPD